MRARTFSGMDAAARTLLPSAASARTVCAASAGAAAASYSSSDWGTALDDADQSAVRLGLHRIQGLNSEAGQRVAARRPYRDVADLARRADLARDDLERLAAAGALASLAGHRRQAAWAASAVKPRRMSVTPAASQTRVLAGTGITLSGPG